MPTDAIADGRDPRGVRALRLGAGVALCVAIVAYIFRTGWRLRA